ncbi:hypothetical protein J6590_057720 [Homalodisca vitripennis]|nr:hypothetical protein J6590_057720 [Homalodisca vitripennis]
MAALSSLDLTKDVYNTIKDPMFLKFAPCLIIKPIILLAAFTTIQPLVTEEQLKQTDSIFKKFGEPGGLGTKLQDLLLNRAEKEENWLAEWWLNTAYLEFRSPVVVYSSPGLVMPQQEFESGDDQLHFAAQLILAVLDFKSLIDRYLDTSSLPFRLI